METYPAQDIETLSIVSNESSAASRWSLDLGPLMRRAIITGFKHKHGARNGGKLAQSPSWSACTDRCSPD